MTVSIRRAMIGWRVGLSLVLVVVVVASWLFFRTGTTVEAPDSHENFQFRYTDQDGEFIQDRTALALPEFGADVLIRLASDPNAAITTDRRRALLDSAFGLAAAAQEPMQRRSPGIPSSSIEGIQALGYRYGIDRLTLESRVVELMATIDTQRTFDLFSRIALPDVPPLSCQDLMTFNFEPYYYAMGNVIASIANDRTYVGEDTRIISAAIEDLRLPDQIFPLIQQILQAKASEFPGLAEQFAHALDTVSVDPRSYSSYATITAAEIANVVRQLKDQSLPTDLLVGSLRGYVTRHSRETCTPPSTAQPRATPCDIFNALVAEIGSMPPLDAAACRPSVPDLGGREPYRLGTGGDWAPIFLEIERLRVASILEKETPGWQASIGALLERIDSVPQAPERSDIAHFIEKGNAYTRLLRMRMDPDPSPGTSANEGEYYADLAIRELRQELLAATIAFASSPYAIDVRRQSPASWFAVFNEQLRFVGQFDLDSTVDAAQLMQASEDPTVALYGHFLGPPSRLSAVTPVN